MHHHTKRSPTYKTLTNIRCLPEPFLIICPWGESNLQRGTTLLYVIVRGVFPPLGLHIVHFVNRFLDAQRYIIL